MTPVGPDLGITRREGQVYVGRGTCRVPNGTGLLEESGDHEKKDAYLRACSSLGFTRNTTATLARRTLVRGQS